MSIGFDVAMDDDSSGILPTLSILPPRSALRLEMPDVECAEISRHFNQVYEFIEEARAKGEGVL